MNIVQYDKGVVNYFIEIFDNTVYGTPQNAFRQLALKSKDEKIMLPALSVYRTDILFEGNANFAQLKQGHRISVGKTVIAKERTLPLVLNYQVDCWGRDQDTSSGLMSELLFRMFDKPGVTVRPEGAPNEIVNYITVSEIVDNTDFSMDVTKGRLARNSILFKLRATLYKYEETDRIYIKPSFHTFDELFPTK